MSSWVVFKWKVSVFFSDRQRVGILTWFYGLLTELILNEIYLNLIPQWDGEDDSFDLNEVSLKELRQFPNLKQATIISSNFEHVKKTFDKQGVQVKVL